MKKIFLLLLLTPLVWGGISFAMDDYCAEETACNSTSTEDKDVKECLGNQKTAQADYNLFATGKTDGTGKKGKNGEIKTKNEEVEEKQKAMAKCITDNTREKLLLGLIAAVSAEEATALCEPDYLPIIKQLEVDIHDLREDLAPFQDSLHCANFSASTSRLNYIGSTTSSFDLENLNVGNEKNLDIVNNVKGDDNILNRILKLLTQVLGTFAVLMLIIGAYYMITSQGDESQLQKGKNIFFYTVIGLLIAFMSFIAVQFVISIIFTSTG